MAIPEYAYTQTVGKKTMANAELPSAWVMFINVKADIIVYKQAAAGGPAVLIPAAEYTVTITPAAPWEFTWTYSGGTTPPPTDFIIIFRRVAAIFNDFQPGAFLNADTLNEAFNIETLANNDQGYYQQFSKPGYNDETLAEHGVFAPPLSPGQDDFHNPKLPQTEYDLPYLAENPANHDDQYVWAFLVDSVGPPRTGKFVSTLLSAAGTPTAGELKNELQRECTGGPPGTNIVGTCTTTIDGLGWTTPPGMTVTEYFGNLYNRSNTTSQNGANLIGFRWSAGVYQGPESVQVALDRLHNIGAAPWTNNTGAAAIGYGGWQLPGGIVGNTVATCLNRLHEPATSPADSGGVHVKWFSPNGSGSESVQGSLDRLSRWQTQTVLLPGGNGGSDSFPAFTGLFADPTHIRMIVIENTGTNSASRVICGPLPAGPATYGVAIPFALSNNTRVVRIEKDGTPNPTWTLTRVAPASPPPWGPGADNYKITAYLRPDF